MCDHRGNNWLYCENTSDDNTPKDLKSFRDFL